MENTKRNIIDAWIRVEQLSEGDIKTNDKKLCNFDDLKEDEKGYDYYHYLMERRLYQDKNNAGLVIYCDVFEFEEVIEILRKKYNIEATEEEMSRSNKFSVALYFTTDLELNTEMLFFTVSGYIRYYRELPDDFSSFESDYREKIEKLFVDTEKSPDGFNKAMDQVMKQYGISLKNCYYKYVENVETDATNLHSFFIRDLEKSKEITTPNLERYLTGFDPRARRNLDSKRTSAGFDPELFREVLRPDNFPLGRFPSNTEYALAFMQQTAVNLAVHDTEDQMRSVNGPPGTGKTTLLKDIFADLIVQQSEEICGLKEKKINGTEDTFYWERASIGELPAAIADHGIVVASSNNGAVQNIVNELPLKKDIDEDLLEELLKADYFTEIANSKVASECKEKNAAKYWGTFSLEGGASAKMRNIISTIKDVLKYFDEEYEPDPEVYQEFEEAKERVEVLKKQAQKFADHLTGYDQKKQELNEFYQTYNELEYHRRSEIEEEAKIQMLLNDWDQQLEGKRAELQVMQERKEQITAEYENQSSYRMKCSGQRPGLFASRQSKREYEQMMEEAAKIQTELWTRRQNLVLEIDDLQSLIGGIEAKRKPYLMMLQESSSKYELKSQELMQQIDRIKKELAVQEILLSSWNGKPLCMELEYDDLQLSNPWFTREYRIAQSLLFIAALKVRKQFLYDNKRNLSAALVVWNNQEKNVGRDNGSRILEASWNWINLCIPIISTTFASLGRMFRHLGTETIGNLFVDEAGQALPQASVGGIFRSRRVMVVGDPFQIKPVLSLDSKIMNLLAKKYQVTEKYLSENTSTQSLIDAASQYGFYKSQEEWIGIPLWVHRRCQYPMFDISNEISYNGYMVQGNKQDGKAVWYDVKGAARDKYVAAQGEFLQKKILELIEKDAKLKDKIYVITPFSNVAYQLARMLRQIGFTKYKEGKPQNVGTVHTFQGKEADIVFMVLGADKRSSGAARWAVSEANMMNVAVTRAKKEFYLIGDRKLYLGLGCEVISTTDRIIRRYNQEHGTEGIIDEAEITTEDLKRVTGRIMSVHPDRFHKGSCYANIDGEDGGKYMLPGWYYKELPDAETIVKVNNRISFIPSPEKKNTYVSKVILLE